MFRVQAVLYHGANDGIHTGGMGGRADGHTASHEEHHVQWKIVQEADTGQETQTSRQHHDPADIQSMHAVGYHGKGYQGE